MPSRLIYDVSVFAEGCVRKCYYLNHDNLMSKPVYYGSNLKLSTLFRDLATRSTTTQMSYNTRDLPYTTRTASIWKVIWLLLHGAPCLETCCQRIAVSVVLTEQWLWSPYRPNPVWRMLLPPTCRLTKWQKLTFLFRVPRLLKVVRNDAPMIPNNFI